MTTPLPPTRDSASTIRIGLVYPDLLGTYGDRGNALVLADRLTRRGIAVELVTVLAGSSVPATLDCYLVGGGEDHTQRVAAEALRHSPLAGAWRDGAVVVGICAGFQLFGTHLELGNGESMEGLALVDARTAPGAQRRVGDAVVDTAVGAVGAVSGFENHRGVTTVGAGVEPLGVLRHDGAPEGVLQDRMLATYLHGPVLARNPALADHVLGWLVGGALPALTGPDHAPALHDTLVTRFGRRTVAARARLRRR